MKEGGRTSAAKPH